MSSKEGNFNSQYDDTSEEYITYATGVTTYKEYDSNGEEVSSMSLEFDKNGQPVSRIEQSYSLILQRLMPIKAVPVIGNIFFQAIRLFTYSLTFIGVGIQKILVRVNLLHDPFYYRIPRF